MMTLEAALAQQSPRIAAWDRSSGGANLLSIVAVDRTDANVIAREKVPATERAALDERMASGGILLGGTHRTCGYVWSLGDSHCGIVKLGAGVQAEAVGSDLVVSGRRIEVASIQSVVSFVDEDDIAHRGVKLRLVNGEEVVVAEETDPAPSIDPTYGRMNLEIDAGWIVFLARELAASLGVAHRDELWDTETPPAKREQPPRAPRGLAPALKWTSSCRCSPAHDATRGSIRVP